MIKKYLKNICFLLPLSYAAFSFADNRSDYNYLARNVNEGQKKSSRQKADEMMMQDKPITPDAGPKVARGADVFLTADFIYWSVRENGLAFAETGSNVINPQGSFIANPNNVSKGKIYKPDFKWEPGFKAGVGLTLNHDGWDIYAQYTWLRSSPNSRSVSRTPNASDDTDLRVVNFTDIPGLNGYTALSFASEKWKFRFNVIDLELGRNFYVSKFLTTRPHIGLKGTWQKDKVRLSYTRVVDVSNNEFLFINSKNNINLWGIGPRAGLNNAWYFTRNFCLFGDFALTALWNRFSIHRKDNDTNDLITFISNRWNKNVIKTIQAILELAIGLRYDVWWKNDNYHFAFQAGWEDQVWFSYNQHYKQYEESDHGNLSLQGLTLEARFDF